VINELERQHEKSAGFCIARFQAGTSNSNTCPPEGDARRAISTVAKIRANF
jgi:hypothetical protein